MDGCMKWSKSVMLFLQLLNSNSYIAIGSYCSIQFLQVLLQIIHSYKLVYSYELVYSYVFLTPWMSIDS
jgi:hypothetical protein